MQCESCKQEFNPKKKTQVYCCYECYRVGYNKQRRERYATDDVYRSNHLKQCRKSYEKNSANWNRDKYNTFAYRIKHKYNLTVEEYEAMLKNQGGLCAICKTKNKKMVIDHDHSCCPQQKSCGKCIRGIICDQCNNGLGRFNDNIGIMRYAIEYLEKWNA